MQYVKFPMKILRITQGYGLTVDGVTTATSGGTYSHTGSYALDLGGADTGADYLYAPCDVVVKRHYKGSGYNAVWYQTVEPVMCADGQSRELIFMLLHANDDVITELGITVDKTFLQGEKFYKEGTGGGVSTHCHIEVGEAPFTGTGWAQSSYIDDRGSNVWIINNKLIPSEIFYLDSDVTVVDDMGYNWKYLSNNELGFDEYTVLTRMKITDSSANIEYFNSPDVNDIAGNNLDTSIEYVVLGKTSVVDDNGWKYLKFIHTDGKEYWVANQKNIISIYEVECVPANIAGKTFFIKNYTTGFNLNVYGTDTVANSRNVNIYAKEDCLAQRWVVRNTSAGAKVYTKIDENYALNIYNDNCTMYVAEDNDADSAVELIPYNSEQSIYRIRLINHNKYLRCEGNASNTNVGWSSTIDDYTLWQFVSESDMFPPETTVVQLTAPTVTIRGNSNGKPQVRWAAIENADKYEVYRSTDYGKSFTKIYTTVYFSMTNVSADVGTYYYKVKAISDNTELYSASDFSNTVGFTVTPPEVERGIDISDYQGVIDWAKVGQTDNKFAIIKAVGSNSNGIYISNYWDANYAGAKANGLKVGAYLYTYAFNEIEADDELAVLFSALKGKEFQYPIFVDVEDNLLKTNCTVAEITATVKYLCEKIKEAGYYAAIYTYTNFADNYLDMTQLQEYDMWIADYRGYIGYAGNYTIWQYSSSGEVSGIDGAVDVNISYVDYETLLKGEEPNMSNTKTFETRLKLKYDTYENWSSNNPILLAGEVAIATITIAQTGTINTVPSVLMKVGDGNKHYNELDFITAKAGDVYDWAKAATKPSYSASEVSGIDTYIAEYVNEQMGISIDTDTQYTISKVNNYQYKLMSKSKIDSSYTTEVAVIDIPNDTEAINTLKNLVGTDSVANQIGAAINALNLSTTYETITNVNTLKERVSTLENKIGSGTGSVSEQINAAVNTESTRAQEAEAKIKESIEAISADYLKEADKEALQTSISTNASNIEELQEQILGLTGAMHFKGSYDEVPTNTSSFSSGDVILVGEKEYVFNGNVFILFGDVTAEGQRIGALELKMTAAEGEIDTLQNNIVTLQNQMGTETVDSRISTAVSNIEISNLKQSTGYIILDCGTSTTNI